MNSRFGSKSINCPNLCKALSATIVLNAYDISIKKYLTKTMGHSFIASQIIQTPYFKGEYFSSIFSTALIILFTSHRSGTYPLCAV